MEDITDPVCAEVNEVFGNLIVRNGSNFGELIGKNASTQFSFFLFLCSIIHVVLTCIVFMWASLHYPEIKARSVSGVIFMGTGVMLANGVGPVNSIVGNNNNPCFAYLTCSYLFIPMVTTPLFVSLLIYYNQVVWAEQARGLAKDSDSTAASALAAPPTRSKSITWKKAEERVVQVAHGDAAAAEADPGSPASSSHKSEGQSGTDATEDGNGGGAPTSSSTAPDPKENRKKVMDSDNNPDAGTTGASGTGAAAQLLGFNPDLARLVMLRFWSSKLFQRFLLIAWVVPYLTILTVRTLSNDFLQPKNGCTGCSLDPEIDAPIMFSSALVAIMVGLYAGWRVRHFHDTLQIASEVRKAFLFGGVTSFIGYAIHSGVPSLAVDEDVHITWVGQIGLQIAFYFFATAPLVRLFRSEVDRRRVMRKQAENERLRQQLQQYNRTDILRILLNSSSHQTLKEQFKERLSRQFAGESLQFYEVATAFFKNFYSRTESARAAQAKKIAKTFVVPGSPVEINVSSETRARILEALGMEKKLGGMNMLFPQMRKMMSGTINLSSSRNLRSSSNLDGSDKKNLEAQLDEEANVSPLEIPHDLFEEARMEMLRLMADGAFVKFLEEHEEEIMKLLDDTPNENA